MQSINWIETYAYGTSKDLVSDKKEIIKKRYKKKINFDDVIKEETKEHNPNWLEIPDHPYRMLTIGRSGPGKTNPLFNLINQQPDIDEIYLYGKDRNEEKYNFFNWKAGRCWSKAF